MIKKDIMVTSNLCVELEPRFDKLENIYYLGKLTYPGTLDLSKGISLIIFLSESGSEQLQLCRNNTENTIFSKYIKKNDRLNIELATREDQYKQTYYIAKIQVNGYIDCNKELVFLVFNSRQNSEQIQLVGDIRYNDKLIQKKQVEVIYAAGQKDSYDDEYLDYDEDEIALCQTNKL